MTTMTAPKRRRRPSRQVCRKRHDRVCYFCREPDYDLLDAHRILPGADGGKYHWLNILTVCSKCHRRVEKGQLVVLGRNPTSTGDWVLRMDVGGKVEFLWPPDRRPVDPQWLRDIIGTSGGDAGGGNGG